MHALNRRCNALAAINSVFFHSCNTPDKVIKALAHTGLSVPPTTINRAVRSLSLENARGFRELGQSLTAAYAYDNFDIMLNTTTPTIEKGTDNLIHMTSALAFRLQGNVTKEDLRCSHELWQRSPLNPHRVLPLPTFKFSDIFHIHPETPHASGLSRRGAFNKWKFVHDLVHYGPEYFQRFARDLKDPDPVEAIPVATTEFLPAHAMDINESRVDGNIEVLENLLGQGGVGDPSLWVDDDMCDSPRVIDIDEFVVLVHGDLSTLERLASAQKSRSIEETSWRRLQSIVTVPGFFHFKMACVDALWRVFVRNHAGRKDDNSFMKFIGVLRPHETGQIGSKPRYRQMHDALRHAGTALRLDAWRVELSRRNPD